MESVTLEFCVAPGDPYDRTLGVMVRSGKTLVAARSYRIAERVRLGEVLLWIDRIMLLWGQPDLSGDGELFVLLDSMEEAITDPF